MYSRIHALVRALGCLAFACLIAGSLHAAVVWDEAEDGDLSSDRHFPTLVPIVPGTNSIVAAMPPSDYDYFTIVVPENHEFTAFIPASYVSEDGISFVAIQEGAEVTPEPPSPLSAEGLLGWTHFGEFINNIGTNILPDLGTSGFGASGFIPPLPSGTYSVWVQQLDGLPTSYQFDIEITPLQVDGLPGDYNVSDTVDAADYTVWRDHLGANFQLPNEVQGVTPGLVTVEDFTEWKARFGNALGGGASEAMLVVPEPNGLWLTAVVSGIVMKKRRVCVQGWDFVAIRRIPG